MSSPAAITRYAIPMLTRFNGSPGVAGFLLLDGGIGHKLGTSYTDSTRAHGDSAKGYRQVYVNCSPRLGGVKESGGGK